jgi:NAD(P)-dependent dehydrogenase (short-subunit alcohol dehydrogenase family)
LPSYCQGAVKAQSFTHEDQQIDSAGDGRQSRARPCLRSCPAEAGCAKIYVAARSAGSERDAVVEPVALDITDERQVSTAAAHCGDVDLLINNAGVARFLPALGAPTMADARLEMETNYFGTLAMCRAFAPVLKRNRGGALVNVLSVVSFFNAPMQGSYCASKAAAWSLTKDIRFELRARARS